MSLLPLVNRKSYQRIRGHLNTHGLEFECNNVPFHIMRRNSKKREEVHLNLVTFKIQVHFLNFQTSCCCEQSSTEKSRLICSSAALAHSLISVYKMGIIVPISREHGACTQRKLLVSLSWYVLIWLYQMLKIIDIYTMVKLHPSTECLMTISYLLP